MVLKNEKQFIRYPKTRAFRRDTGVHKTAKTHDKTWTKWEIKF